MIIRKQNIYFFLYAVAAAILLCANFSRADVTLPDVLSSGMVFQRDRPVRIWGKAEPNEEVSVAFAGQRKKTKAGPDGNWRVKLSPLQASSTSRTLTITGKNTIELKDILVGEVWLLSGQSNMELTLRGTSDGAAAIAAANHPAIRLFNVNRKVAFKHQDGPLATWKASSPESIVEFSAAGYYFGVDLHQQLNVPIGLINSSFGGSQAEAWTPLEELLASADLRPCVERGKLWEAERPKVQAEYDQKLSEWRVARDAAKAQGLTEPRQPPAPDALREYRLASSIYNGMIAPLIPFTIRGAIWYQGESNEARAQQYQILLPTMISAWRKRWAEGAFPFGIVQLPNYRAIKTEPSDEAWSHLREAQRRSAANVPNSGLIITIDIGEADNIHPKNKLELGKRMSRWALGAAYKRKLVRTGPMLRKAKPSKSRMLLTFAEVGGGLKIRDGELHEFAIAGEDRVWHWASARIVAKDRVEVWSDAVPAPVAVRYAFNSNPKEPNLINDVGLPAAPFRTDNWPGPTDGKR